MENSNKKNNLWTLASLGLAVAVLMVFIGGGFWGQGFRQAEFVQDSEVQAGSEGTSEEAGDEAAQAGEGNVMTAMYVPITDEVYILVDEDNGAVFTAHFPEELYNIEGERITREQLQKGNLLKIYGDGIMAESYPGQYPGVSRMEVIQEGRPEDADKYQDIVAEIYQEPDPAEPPTLNAEYTTELAVVTAMITRGGYEWTYTDQDGLSNAVVADSAHVLQWGEDIADIRLSEPLEVRLIFSKHPQEVEVVRYGAGLMGTEGDIPEGEAVEAEIGIEDGIYVIPKLEAGYVYEVTGIWENGRATVTFHGVGK